MANMSDFRLYVWSSLNEKKISKANKYWRLVDSNMSMISRVLKLYVKCNLKKRGDGLEKWENPAIYYWYSRLNNETMKDVLESVVSYMCIQDVRLIYRQWVLRKKLADFGDCEFIKKILMMSPMGILDWYEKLEDEYEVVSWMLFINIDEIRKEKFRARKVCMWRALNNKKRF